MKLQEPINLPYYKRLDRLKTDHANAIATMKRGWTWNGKKYECRQDWESAILRYHGAFTL